MIKKNRKWIVGILSLCLIWCLSFPIPVYALNPTVLISNASISTSNGISYVSSRSGYNLYVIDLNNTQSGSITLTTNSNFFGTILFSNDDIPSNVNFNYYFVSNNSYNFITYPVTYDFVDYRYIYISSNRAFTYTINFTIDPDPTPTNTPTPTPTNTPTPTPTNTPTSTPSPVPTNPINPPDPSNTPTPIPTGSGGYGIPLEYLIPFDYYMIAIIILLGGILICQLFKN